MSLRLKSNWKLVATRAWSMWLIALSTALSGLEIVVQVFIDEPPVPRGLFAAMAFFITVGAGLARLLVQENLDEK